METKLVLRPISENSEKYYTKENIDKHNNSQDSGFDLYCPTSFVVPPRAISYKIPLGVQGVLLWGCAPTRRLGTGETNIGIDGDEWRLKAGRNPIPTAYTLHARSSTGSRTPLRLANQIGIIDAGYRGEICAFVDNMSDKEFAVEAGERIFQLCAPQLQHFWASVATEDDLGKLFPSARGSDGFGSTGR